MTLETEVEALRKVPLFRGIVGLLVSLSVSAQSIPS